MEQETSFDEYKTLKEAILSGLGENNTKDEEYRADILIDELKKSISISKRKSVRSKSNIILEHDFNDSSSNKI